MEEECKCMFYPYQDWEGNPDIPYGTRVFTVWKCMYCGEEQDETPPDEQIYYNEPDYGNLQ